MITLYTFGPFFGLPDGSPFVTKVMLLLKLAGLPYQIDQNGYGKAPKGKLPYINDNGLIVADSTLIRFHIEDKYQFDFDTNLTEEQKAISWAVEKMCEEHLYFAMLDIRWGQSANFAKGPAQFFNNIPIPMRALIKRIATTRIKKSLKVQGLGRHDRPDLERMAIRDLRAISTILGDKPFLLGDKPCAADASVFGIVAGILAPIFDSPIRTAAEHLPNLVTYRDQISAQYFA